MYKFLNFFCINFLLLFGLSPLIIHAMEQPNFEAMLSEAQRGMEALLGERQTIDQKILALRQTIRGLETLLHAESNPLRLPHAPLPKDLEGLQKLGMTDAVRLLLEKSPVSLKATDIRDQLIAFGYPTLPKVNPMATIHGVLNRLRNKGTIRVLVGREGKDMYEWNSPVYETKFGGYTVNFFDNSGVGNHASVEEVAKKRKPRRGY